MAQITINIDDAKIAEFKAGFIRSTPFPVDANGVSLYPNTNAGLAAWVKDYLIIRLKACYKAGKQQLAHDNNPPVTDDTILS